MTGPYVGTHESRPDLPWDAVIDDRLRPALAAHTISRLDLISFLDEAEEVVPRQCEQLNLRLQQTHGVGRPARQEGFSGGFVA